MSDGYKYIKKSEKLVRLGAQDVWSFDRFVVWLIENDHVLFNSDGQGIRAGARIRQEAVAEKKVMRVTKEDRDRLAQSANGPRVFSNGNVFQAYPTTHGGHWLDFVEAIDAALDEDPEAKAA
jgi:hypothetical protein